MAGSRLSKIDSSPDALAEELLGRPYEDLDDEEQRAISRVLSSDVALDPDEEEALVMSHGDRVADRVAEIGGSWGFISFFGVILVVWIVINGPLGAHLGIVWDAYPFILLNLALSCLAAVQAPIIMMSQNRQAKKDRIANRHDYEVNLRTTVEIIRLHRKIDRMFNKMGQLQGDVKEVATAAETAVERATELPTP